LTLVEAADFAALRLGAAGKALPTGIAILDSRGETVWLNRRLCAWLGYDGAGPEGRGHPVHEEDRPALARAAADAVTLGEAIAGLRLVRADGGLVESHWHIAPIDPSYAHGDLVAHVVESGRACSHEIKLALNERRLASLVELTNLTGGTDGKVAEFALEKAVELTGSEIGYLHFYREAEQMLELTIWSSETMKRCTASPVNHYPLSEAGVWADSIRLRQPVIHNHYPSAPGGRGLPEGHFPVHRHLGVPVFGEGGRIVAAIGVGNKEELIDARNAAQRASNAKSDFLANMSHEMRTPLNAILGFSEFLQMELFGPLGDDRYRDYAHDIAKAAHQLLAIVNDLLDLARIEKGRLRPEEGRFNLVRLIDAAVRTVGLHGGNGGVRIECRCPFSAIDLTADRRLIAQLLLTLFGNAVTVSPPGSVVEIDVAAGDDGGLSLSVLDRGPAMSEEEVEIATTPFVRIAAPTTSAERGSGLGLAIAKSLLELHGGTLAVSSDEDAGTTVTAALPAQRVIAVWSRSV
jgi:signal transduction histidine kinase